MEKLRLIRTVAEYDGQPAIRLGATQLDGDYTRSEATRILAEWCEFFQQPSPITELQFVSRTPKRLFAALAGQTQLRRLALKWGDYEDLGALAGMVHLETLVLGGASSVRTVEPLTVLRKLHTLRLESLRFAKDLSPLRRLTSVTDLEFGGDWQSPRNAHVESIAFLAEMPQLRSLVMQTLIVDDRDYSPLLGLSQLETLVLRKARGIKPNWEALMKAIPALARHQAGVDSAIARLDALSGAGQ